MNKRESLVKKLETQAYWCQVIADKLRKGIDPSDDIWTSDVFTTDEWKAEITAIEAQERLEFEHNQAIESEARTA